MFGREELAAVGLKTGSQLLQQRERGSRGKDEPGLCGNRVHQQLDKFSGLV